MIKHLSPVLLVVMVLSILSQSVTHADAAIPQPTRPGCTIIAAYEDLSAIAACDDGTTLYYSVKRDPACPKVDRTGWHTEQQDKRNKKQCRNAIQDNR